MKSNSFIKNKLISYLIIYCQLKNNWKVKIEKAKKVKYYHPLILIPNFFPSFPAPLAPPGFLQWWQGTLLSHLEQLWIFFSLWWSGSRFSQFLLPTPVFCQCFPLNQVLAFLKYKKTKSNNPLPAIFNDLLSVNCHYGIWHVGNKERQEDLVLALFIDNLPGWFD